MNIERFWWVFILGGLAIVTWVLPKAGEKFANFFVSAERRYRLPPNLLARMAYQESHFREDIISGKLKSKAGAVGLMQIIPKLHPGIDPLDAPAAIMYAGSFMAQNFKTFGNWRDAIAAYNWGPGNVSRWIKGGRLPEKMPKETRDYVNGVAGDIGLV